MKMSPPRAYSDSRAGVGSQVEKQIACSVLFLFALKNWVEGNQVEVIFVSSDRSEAAQMDYMKEAHG